jgi:hypothetical protein
MAQSREERNRKAREYARKRLANPAYREDHLRRLRERYAIDTDYREKQNRKNHECRAKRIAADPAYYERFKAQLRAKMCKKRADPAFRAEIARKAREKRATNPTYREQENKKNRDRKRDRRVTDPTYRDEQNRKAYERDRKRRADPIYREERNRKKRERLANDPAYRERKRKARELAAADPAFREKQRMVECERRRVLKLEFQAAYGGECADCGETKPDFLTLEHSFGDGKAHRERVGGGINTYRDLQLRGWPQDEGLVLLCWNCHFKRTYKHRHKLFPLVVEAYGGRCACCGEADLSVLTVEHSFGDGKAHRKRIGGGGSIIQRDLKKRGWPQDEGITILCWNCNVAKGRFRGGGVCPHEKETKCDTEIKRDPQRGRTVRVSEQVSRQDRSDARGNQRHEQIPTY